MLGQLDGVGADAAGAGVDEDLLAGPQLARSTSACQAVSATRGTEAASAMVRLAGFDRDVVLVDGDALGERADAAVARSRVDLVAHGEAGHGRPDAGDDAGEVVPEDERRLVGQERA